MRKNKTKGIWMLLVLVFITVVLYVFVSRENPKPSQEPHILKTGAGAVVDYTSVSQKYHEIVDDTIKNSEVVLVETQSLEREVPRRQVEGLIKWNTRNLLVRTTGITDFRQRLSAALTKSGGQLLDVQADNYKGMGATRFDVGFRGILAGDEITIITDRIYIVANDMVKDTNGKTKGKIAIIVDDFGYSHESIEDFAQINRPLTWAVLPHRPYTQEVAKRGIASGHQVILHLPMEPLNRSSQTEQRTIMTNMSDQEISEQVRQAIKGVPGIIGVNNHQGSRATADNRVMSAVLRTVKAHNLFFIDSHTSSNSVGADLARQAGIPTGRNELFIDNVDDVDAVKEQLRRAKSMALKHGSIIVIGHARANTAQAIKEMIAELERDGVRLVFVSQLVN